MPVSVYVRGVLVRLCVCLSLSIAAAMPAGAQSKRPATPKAGAPKAAATKPAPKPNPVVSLAGLQIVAKGLGKGRFRDAIAFDGKQGVSLALAVRVAPGTSILEIEEDDCVVESWTDDKQTDLNIEPDWDSFPTYTEDQTGALISVRSPLAPSAGSQAVSIAGSLAVVTAAGTRTVQARKVALTKGTSFQLGTLAALIGDVEPADTGATVSVKLTGTGASGIKRLRFLDAAGTELESDANGSMSSPGEVELMYTLKAKAAVATIELEQWQNLETMTVPFSLSATVGGFR